VLPVVDLQPGSTAVTTFRSGSRVLGVVRSGDIGVQGVSSAPGALLPVTLQAALPAGAAIITATTTAMIEPLVSRYVLGGGGHGSALLRGASRITENTTVASPAKGAAVIDAHNGSGHLALGKEASNATTVPVAVRAEGFTIVRR
jgi:hypothetical protein